MNDEKLMIKDPFCKNHFIPKALCTFDTDSKMNGGFSCEEYCSHIKCDCTECPVQSAFDKLAAYERNMEFYSLCDFYKDQLIELFQLIALHCISIDHVISFIRCLAPYCDKISPSGAMQEINKFIEANQQCKINVVANQHILDRFSRIV